MRARSLAMSGCIGVLALLLGACFAPSYPTGIPCSELDTCPPDQFCVEGICRLEPGSGPGDADASIPQPPDASISQPPDAPPPPPDASPLACTAPADCNDGVPCTTDTCVDQRCVNTVDDSACNDSVACTTDRCDAVQGCVATPNDAACNDDDTCTSDVCSAETSCVNEPIRFCTTPCVTVLIYNDFAPTGYDLPMRAAEALGMPATVAGDESSFVAAFDAGGFDLIIIDASDAGVPAGVTSRLLSWLDSGGRLVFAHFNLDADPTLRAALGVNAVRELNPAPPVHADPNSPINFFTLREQIPSPLSFGDEAFADNGDALTLAAQGFVAARFESATSSEGAILVTRNDRVVVMGFLPGDLFFSGTDADSDGINDGDELYRNEIRFLCSAPPQ
jgi:hypothetical protein